MKKNYFAQSIIALSLLALLLPVFAFACHTSAPAAPSVLNDLSTAFGRFR